MSGALIPQIKHPEELGGLQLLNPLIASADKLSMAHRLQARGPYLDRTVLEYAQRLNSDLKIRNGTRK